MTDTSLVFSLLGKDVSVSRVLGVIGGAFRSAGQVAESSMRKATTSTERLDRQIEEVERDLAKLNAEFARTGDKTLFGKISRDRSLLNQLRRVRAEVEDNNRSIEDGERSTNRFANSVGKLGSFLSGAASAVGQFGGVAGSVTSNLWGAVTALTAVSGALVAIGPAASLAGGALGSIPTMLTGGAAAVGTLKLGLFGLGEEYQRLTKVSGGGGGGATKAAKDFTAANRAVEQAVKAVARAEKDVRDAQRDALDAQRAINEARETAAERMHRQATDLREAQLDQADAADDVTAAQAELNTAIAKGDPKGIEEARRGLERAQIAAERAKDRVDELTEANAENATKGVEGSDEVTEAKKREEQARQRVADAIGQEKDAEKQLADARASLAKQKSEAASGGGGGGGGGGQQVTKLAPAAREFLNTIIGLRPAFERLRLGVQQKLFAGLADKMSHLADVWKGPLTKTLGSFASTFNSIAKTVFSSVSKKSFIDNMTSGAESFRVALKAVGTAVGGPLVDAFGRLSRAAGPFVRKLGSLLAGVITDFSNWIKRLDKSGGLDRFFKGAASTLDKVWKIGKNVFSIVGKIVGIVFDQSKSAGDSALDSINAGLTSLSVWLDDPKNQKMIQELVAQFIGWGKAIGDIIKQSGELRGAVGPAFKVLGLVIKTSITPLKLLWTQFSVLIGGVKWIWRNAPRAWDGLTGGLSAAVKWIGKVGSNLVTWVGRLPGHIRRAARGMWDGIKDAFRSAVNWMIGKWNNLHLTIGGGSFLGASIPSARFDTPDIQYLAKGGIVPATPGGRLAVLGEGGRDEAVIPLDRARGLGANGEVRVVIDLRGGDAEMRRMVRKWIRVDNLLQPAG